MLEPRGVTIEGNVIDVIVRREPGAPMIDGIPNFHESRALIDTGASDICIDYRIAHALALRQIDQTSILTAGGAIEVSVFNGLFEVPLIGFSRMMRLFAPKIDRINYNVLIGRSLLRDYLVTFDGPADLCTIAPPPLVHGHVDDE